MNGDGYSAFGGRVVFYMRYRVAVTDALAERTFSEMMRLQIVAQDRAGELLSMLRVVTHTRGIDFNLQAEGEPQELLDLKDFWEWFNTELVERRAADGTLLEMAQDEPKLRQLWERVEFCVGLNAQNFWTDAYVRVQGTYAPLAPKTITRPENLTKEELNDPNSDSARRQHRYRIRAAAQARAEEPEEILTMPDNWGFNYDERLVIRAFDLWEASGFVRIPTLEEVMSHNADWEADVALFGRLVRFRRNKGQN